MWNFFIHNSKFGYLFMVALMLLGTYTLIAIPKESAPEVIIPVGIVTTILPGAPASDVETLVTNELERGLVGLENVKQITSVSRESVSSITVEFEASADINESIADLKDAVDTLKADLPETAEDPTVTEINFSDQPIMSIAFSGDLSDYAFTELIDDVEDEIESIPGVSRVDSSGVRDKEVAIIIDQAALLRYGLTLNQVISAIRSANQTLPIGQIENDGISYNVAFEGDLATSDDIKNIGVATIGGQPVYIRDIAVVEDGLAPAASLSRVSIANEPSQNAVSISVFKQSGGDITAITANINSRLAELQAPDKLLNGIEVLTVLDAGKDIRTDLIRLSSSGLQTVILVGIILVIAIGWREGLLAGISVPLSFLFGFIGLYLSGNTINFLSLFALILGIGILVDSAIVMVEDINHRLKADPTIDKKQAALDSIEEFKAPLISGTLTTVAMFVGLFVVGGVIGQFISSIPFTLVFILLASIVVALAMVPLLAVVFLRRRSETKMEQMQVEYAHRFEEWYRGKLAPFIEDEQKADNFLSLLFALLVGAIFLAINAFAGIIAGLLLYYGNKYLLAQVHKQPGSTDQRGTVPDGSYIVALVISYLGYPYQPKTSHVPKQPWSNLKYRLAWFPMVLGSIAIAVGLSMTILPSWKPVQVIFFEQGDVDYVIVEVEEPEGTTKEVTDISTRRVEEILYAEPDVDSFVVTVGSGSQFTGGGSGEKFSNIFITLTPDRERTSTEVVDDLREKFAPLTDLEVSVNQPSDGPPTGAAIIVKFLGEDLNELTETVNRAALLLQETPGIVNVEKSTNNNSTEFVLELDRAKAASLGLDAFTVSQIARTAVFGADATSITTLSDDIDVVVKLNVANNPDAASDTTNQATIDALNRISVPTRDGSVPLSSLVTVSLRESSSVINHEDQQRVVSLTADVAAGANARDAQAAALERIQAEIDIPDGVTISTGGGEAEESNEAFIEMFLALIVGILLMVGILVLQFNSYLHTRYVLSILPYSLIGIFAGLALTQSPLSFPSMMGFIALCGIIVNNSILLIDMMNRMRSNEPSRPIKEIVVEASVRRLRPIVLTTTTTVVGMIPLVFAGALWAPLAYAVMFGLLFSVVITLILIPITYYRKPGEVSR